MVMCELAFAGKTEIRVKQRFRKALGLISKRRSLKVEANCFLYLQECLGLFGHSQKFLFFGCPSALAASPDEGRCFRQHFSVRASFDLDRWTALVTQILTLLRCGLLIGFLLWTSPERPLIRV